MSTIAARFWSVFAIPALLGFGSTAPSRGERAALHNFVFFGRDRDRIREASFLENESIAGAQLKYTWRELEPERGRYLLQPILDDVAFLARHDKRLFVQLQDASFDEKVVLVPQYLIEDVAYGGGVARKYEMDGDDESTARSDGWVARRWDPAVRGRFVALLDTLGATLDGRIEGLNLAETSIDFGASGKLHPAGFTYEGYAEGVKASLSAARAAFPRSHVIQYANFMPGEWLPWTDHGYLRGIYEHAERMGCGVGGPDLLPHRKGQQNHSYPLVAARASHVVAGIAVQDGNLSALNPTTGKPVTVGELYDFARDRLRLDYIFWGTQEPYYSSQILPHLRALHRARHP